VSNPVVCPNTGWLTLFLRFCFWLRDRDFQAALLQALPQPWPNVLATGHSWSLGPIPRRNGLGMVRGTPCRGAPRAVYPPGLLSRFGHALREPFGNIHVVGTKTAFEWKGYMEGAVRVGERGASEVVSTLVARSSL
jgi:hypothetical protein